MSTLYNERATITIYIGTITSCQDLFNIVTIT